jgi:flagellin
MVINTNIAALNAANQLQQNSANLSASLARLSSGSKITSPADDSAGLAVSMKLGAQITRVGAAQQNVSNAISFNQTQDGYLQQVNTALTRMSELAVSAQDVTKTSADLKLYSQEYTTLGQYVNNVATKQFNGVTLFGGGSLEVTTDSDPTGTATAPGSYFANTGVSLGTTTYTNATGANLLTNTAAAAALGATTTAINQLATDRASIGANEETLGYYSAQLSSLSNNLSAAKSQITDVDVASESTEYAKENILVQSGTAMLAQANSMPQSVLRLLS